MGNDVRARKNELSECSQRPRHKPQNRPNPFKKEMHNTTHSLALSYYTQNVTEPCSATCATTIKSMNHPRQTVLQLVERDSNPTPPSTVPPHLDPSSTPDILNFGDLNVLTFMEGFTVLKSGEHWLGLGMSYTTNDLFRLDFPDFCTGAMPIINSTDFEPANMSYQISGDYWINLIGYDQWGNADSLYRRVGVSSVTAPDMDFTLAENLCLSNPIIFQ